MPSITDRVQWKKNFAPQNIKKLPSKVAHNPTRPRVFKSSKFLLCATEVLYMSFDRFLLAVESRDLSQADESII